jgi:hypothetical protein
MTRGVINEPLAKTTFEMNSGHCLIPLDSKALFCRKTIFNGNLSTTPDGITYCGLLFEAKCPKVISKAKVKYYEDQVQAMLNTIGLETGILFQYDVATGKSLAEIIQRDYDWASKASQKVNKHVENIDFMSHVLSHPLYQPSKNKTTIFKFQDIQGNILPTLLLCTESQNTATSTSNTEHQDCIFNNNINEDTNKETS